MMKQFFLFMALSVFVVLLSGCSDDSGDGYSSPVISDDSEASLTSDVSTFDVAINTESMSETETIPSDDNDYVENSVFSQSVSIVFGESGAMASGDVDGVTVECNGNNVIVRSSASEVEYKVSGSTDEGSLKIYSDKKFKLELGGVSITNPQGPAINIQSKKRVFVVLTEGTVNTLTDGSSYTDITSGEDMKACLFSEGQLIFSGEGRLNVYGNCKAGIRSDDYVVIRPNSNIYVKTTAGNGIKGNDALTIYGGVVNVETTANGAKALSSDGNVLISGGRTTLIATGQSIYDSSEKDITGSACLKADSTFTITGGELYAKNTGKGGKGISVDMQAIFDGGTVGIITTGTTYKYNSSLDSKAKGIKADGDISINGGTLKVRASGGDGCEGIETKGIMMINGGTVAAYAYDDAINSASHLYIRGGVVYVHSTSNDGLDSNGNLYIQGGNVFAYGSKAPECGIDANEEDGYTVYFSGGNLFAIGGGNSTPSNTSSVQGYVTTTGSVSAGSTAVVSDGSNTLASFTLPAGYSSGSILITTNGMTAGSGYTLTIGNSSATLTAQQYGSSNFGGGMPGGPGRR